MKTSDPAGHKCAARGRQKTTSRTWGPIGGERLKKDVYSVNFLTTKRWHVEQKQYGRWREVQHSSYPPWAPFGQEEPPAWPGKAAKPWPERSSCIRRGGRGPSPPRPPTERERRCLPQVSRDTAGRVCREECFCPFFHQLWSELGGCSVSSQHTPGNPRQPELCRA